MSIDTSPDSIDSILHPRNISRQNDATGRSEMAASIWARRRAVDRSQHFSNQNHEIIEQKRREIAEILMSPVFKLKSLLRMSQADEEKIRQLTAEIEDAERENRTQNSIVGELKQDAREVLTRYYEQMAFLPLSNEEKRKYLDPEILRTLTLDQYIALWRRLNPYFLAHVTRQGFRDHNATIYHSGYLDEFTGGFKQLLGADRNLLPPLAVEGLVNRNRDTIKNILSEWELLAETEEEALKRWHDHLLFTWAKAPKYPDKTAIHFTTQMVADEWYGGESGNEVFFIFPSDFVASQYDYAFNGREKDFTRPQSDTMWNDVFVWPRDLNDPRISLDCGIVFLPKSIPVDPETGSKYASQVSADAEGLDVRVNMIDYELKNKFVTFCQSPEGIDFLQSLFTSDSKSRDYFHEGNNHEFVMRSIAEKLKELGFADDVVDRLADKIFVELHWRESFATESLEKILKDTRACWQRPPTTITSEQYWENYFSTHPDTRPAHVVFYDGDPSNAIFQFLSRNKIGRADTSDTEGKLLGFGDRHVTDMGSDPRTNRGFQELYDLGKEIIVDHFKNPTKAPASP